MNNTEIKNIEQLVVFELGDEEYGSNIHQVREIVDIPEITKMPRTPGLIRGVMNLRGQVIAVVDLIKRFGLPEQPDKQSQHVIVVDMEDYSVGMVVDEVIEVLRITEENIEDTPKLVEKNIDDEFIDGIAKVEDRLIIILNLFRVLTDDDSARLRELTSAVEQEEREEPEEPEQPPEEQEVELNGEQTESENT